VTYRISRLSSTVSVASVAGNHKIAIQSTQLVHDALKLERWPAVDGHELLSVHAQTIHIKTKQTDSCKCRILKYRYVQIKTFKIRKKLLWPYYSLCGPRVLCQNMGPLKICYQLTALPANTNCLLAFLARHDTVSARLLQEPMTKLSKVHNSFTILNT